MWAIDLLLVDFSLLNSCGDDRTPDAQKPGFLTRFKAATRYFRQKPGTFECLRLIPEFVKLGIFMDSTIIFVPPAT
ncbi:hypothetical protein QUB05_27135 [Microcoleus sp. F10-C6]|uniref:hypothetical protein n=1 Tax=unclassified Microcoleus TaxID=2642155 RepID=UPI002FD1A212